ncbi:hypothetical protein DdX_11114 [Ditylenchus destructor]|uniref:F-box domain-containing protein n=1 Tax=Ditylenchus destructor TaxID=166010 RepID=A0AAD4MZW3_9BILA|nr:hypothetical protein DdX_11114 [Ditylenchus destructor]
MVLPPEILKDIFSNMDRQNLIRLQICSRILKQLVQTYFPLYPLKKVEWVDVTRTIKRKSNQDLQGEDDNLIYVAAILENDSKFEFESADPVEVIKWILGKIKSSAVVDGMSLSHLPLSPEILALFVEFGPTIRLADVWLYNVWDGEGTSMEMLIQCFSHISKAHLRGDPEPAQTTDSLIRACKEKGVASLRLQSASLMHPCSLVSEDGILNFLFGSSEVDPVTGIRFLEIDGPTITSNFFKRLVESNKRHTFDDMAQLLIYNLECKDGQDTSGYEQFRKMKDSGECYLFREQIPFKVWINRNHKSIEMWRGTGFKESDDDFKLK